MNKVLIECDTLIDEYELSRENIIKQLECMCQVKK
jgi:hypothetical protein